MSPIVSPRPMASGIGLRARAHAYLTSQEGVLGPPSCCQPNHSALITDRNQTDYDVTDSGGQTDKRWSQMDRRADTVEKTDRQTDRQREDRQTDRWTDRQEAERAILTVIEVFIWIEGDLDT